MTGGFNNEAKKIFMLSIKIAYKISVQIYIVCNFKLCCLKHPRIKAHSPLILMVEVRGMGSNKHKNNKTQDNKKQQNQNQNAKRPRENREEFAQEANFNRNQNQNEDNC